MLFTVHKEYENSCIKAMDFIERNSVLRGYFWHSKWKIEQKQWWILNMRINVLNVKLLSEQRSGYSAITDLRRTKTKKHCLKQMITFIKWIPFHIIHLVCSAPVERYALYRNNLHLVLLYYVVVLFLIRKNIQHWIQWYMHKIWLLRLLRIIIM